MRGSVQPSGVHAYYSRSLATGRSVPAAARALTAMHLIVVQGAPCFTVILRLASLISLLFCSQKEAATDIAHNFETWIRLFQEACSA